MTLTTTLAFALLILGVSSAAVDPVADYFKPVTVLGNAYKGENGVVMLNSSSFNTAIGTDGSAWLLKFYAPWCGHCKRLAPVFEQLAQKVHGGNQRVGIAKVDATYEKALSARFPLKGYPTVFFIKGGEVYLYEGKRSVGDFSKYIAGEYTTGTKLGQMESPLGVVGQLKGLVVLGGVHIADWYEYLTDLNGMRWKPWQAITAICAAGLTFTFFFGLFCAWLFNLTEPSHPHLD
jgi:protein disulfide-isomerase-like protein